MDNCIYCGKKLENGETTCPGCGHEIKEYRSLESYPYEQISASAAAEFENRKVGMFKKGAHKKIVAALQEGNIKIAPVMVEKVFTITSVDSNESDVIRAYANISDMEGYPAKEAPRIQDRYEESSMENEKEYLLSYKLKKTPNYYVIDQDTVDHIADFLLEIPDISDPDPVERELPTMEGSLADRGGKLLSKLFKK